MDFRVSINYFDIMGMAKKNYGKALEPLCRKWELTRNELDILLFLYNNPEFDRAADIVSRRGIAKSHVSMSVASLEERGALTRRFDPTDRRQAHLELTEQGQEIAGEARAVQHSYFSGLYQGVTEEELEVWREITQKVCDNIEKFNKTLAKE